MAFSVAANRVPRPARGRKGSGSRGGSGGNPRAAAAPNAGGMSSQRGNVARSRPQRHQNSRVFKNDKHDTSAQRKKINAKLHDGVCHHCKEVLEWRVKFNKYKPLSKPKKCVKCLQKTVKDSYHIICRPCACELEVCAKCGKEEEIVVPISKGPEKTEDETTGNCQRRINRRDESEESEDLDLDIDLNGTDNKNPDMLEEKYEI